MKVKKKLIFFQIITSLLLVGCSVSQKKELNKTEIKKPDSSSYRRPENVVVNGKDLLQVQYSIGKFGGSINLPMFGSGLKTFNLWASTDATSSEVGSLLFDSLFDTDPTNGEIIPKLAKGYEIKDGGKTVIVKLRNGAKWSDGKPITSDDVVFTWNDIVFSGLEGGGFYSLCLIDGKYPTVKKIDDTTVEFMTHIVFSPFLRQISYPPAPKHIFEPLIKGKSTDEAKSDFLRFWGVDVNPKDIVTSGPFKLSRYVKGERLEFVKNPEYYIVNKKNEKLPYLSRLNYILIQDKSFELFKFIASELDVIDVRGEDVALLKELQKKGKFQIVNLGPTSSTDFLVFNLHRGDISEFKSEWFNNLNFRKAISFAIDRLGIVDNVLAGIGKPLFTPESHGSIYLNKKISEGYPQNLELSKKLLKEGGFAWDEDGNLLDKKKNKIEFTILSNAENITRQSIGVIIQDDLKKLGIKANFRPIDFNTLIGRNDAGNWEAIIIGFTGGFFEPNNGANVWRLDGRLHMFDQKPHKPRSWEIEIDKIFNDATKVVEFEKRKKYYDKFQEIVYEELPFIYLVSPLKIEAFQNSLGNILPTIYASSLHNIESVYKKN